MATKKHILLVDDCFINCGITASILRDEGYSVSIASDGQIALDFLQKQEPDLILLDVVMPGMNGLEVCRQIKLVDRLKDIPVIFVTNKKHPDDIVEGFKVGGVDYITKPFIRNELLIRVENHIELADSKKKILEMNQTRDKLYSILAHDIRSPLSSISMVVSTINHKLIDPSSDAFYEIISDVDKSTKNTLSLLENLLVWTKSQSGTISFLYEHNNLLKLIQDCVGLLDGNAKAKKISIDIDVDENTYAYFDEVTVNAVFRNILSNSIKFTPEHGTISIVSRQLENEQEISFQDSGIGMSEDVIRRIFVENQHYTTNGTNNEVGSGLGLFMVKDLIQKNNGRLSVASEKGKGTLISVFLPIAN